MSPSVLEDLWSRSPGRQVARALERLLSQDGDLLRIDANERSITFRLGIYLQAEFPHWNVDCEYNRDHIDPKRIQRIELCAPDVLDTEAKTVFPDIIVHRRQKKENHLVIEVKKSTNREPRTEDFAKLRGYKESLGYDHALFIELGAGREPTVDKVEWIDVEL